VTKQHPIIREFLNTNRPLSEIIPEFYDRTQFLEAVLVDVLQKGEFKEVDQELMISMDRAIITGHHDQSLFLIFLCQSIFYYCRFHQLEKAKSIDAIASSVSFKEIDQFIVSWYLQSHASILRFEGKSKEYLNAMEESIEKVDKNNSRFYLLYHNYLFVYATLGTLKENGVYRENPFPWPSKKEKDLKTAELKLMNCVRIGDLKEGFRILKDFKSQYGLPLPFSIEDYDERLRLISGEFNPALYEDSYFNCMAQAYQLSATGKSDEGVNCLKRFPVEDIRIHNMHHYSNYLEIHHELSMKQSGKARLLLQEKAEKGNLLFIDDLFFGRIFLLENDWLRADETFARLSDNVVRYGAINQLIFELHFAKEMRLTHILKLINGWKSEGVPIKKNMSKSVVLKPKIAKKGVDLLVGKSRSIQIVKDLIKKYAPLKSPVLVTGETGSGKELVSRAIHDEGLYSDEPFLAINCGALTDTLLESELFGYDAGAFTGAQRKRQGVFAAAGKGTVFLDEFGDISPKLQVTLLRVLEAGEIRMLGSTTNQKIECKIVIATNVDLHKNVIDKKFREDLFFRLSRFEIRLPALRERKEDLPELIQYFLDQNENMDMGQKAISNELLAALLTYHWPGNIRELKNEIDRLIILNPLTENLGVSHFDFSRLKITPEVIEKDDEPSIVDVVSNNTLDQIMQSGFRYEQRHDLVLSIFKKYKKVTRKQLIEITKVCPATISNDLKVLMQAGKIVRRTPTNSPRSHFFELS